jgi:hypothetical protein
VEYAQTAIELVAFPLALRHCRAGQVGVGVGFGRLQLGRKRSFKVDAAFWVIAGFDHFVITIKIASEVKMRNRIKEFLSLR